MICFEIKIIKLLRRREHPRSKERVISVKIVSIAVHVKRCHQFAGILKLLPRNHRLFNAARLWCFFHTRTAFIVKFLRNLLFVLDIIIHRIFIISIYVFIRYGCSRFIKFKFFFIVLLLWIFMRFEKEILLKMFIANLMKAPMYFIVLFFLFYVLSLIPYDSLFVFLIEVICCLV